MAHMKGSKRGNHFSAVELMVMSPPKEEPGSYTKIPGLCGFRVWDLGFRVWGSGFRVWGLGFGV